MKGRKYSKLKKTDLGHTSLSLSKSRCGDGCGKTYWSLALSKIIWIQSQYSLFNQCYAFQNQGSIMKILIYNSYIEVKISVFLLHNYMT